MSSRIVLITFPPNVCLHMSSKTCHKIWSINYWSAINTMQYISWHIFVGYDLISFQNLLNQDPQHQGRHKNQHQGWEGSWASLRSNGVFWKKPREMMFHRFAAKELQPIWAAGKNWTSYYGLAKNLGDLANEGQDQKDEGHHCRVHHWFLFS